MTDFKAASVEISAVPSAGSARIGEVVPKWSDTVMDPDVTPSVPVALHARVGDADALIKLYLT